MAPSYHAEFSLNSHRHDNIFETCIVRQGNQSGRIGIAQGDADLIALEVVEYIEQIGDVESYIDAVSAVVDFQLFCRLFLVSIGRADLQAARRDHAAYAFEFVGGHDG